MQVQELLDARLSQCLLSSQIQSVSSVEKRSALDKGKGKKVILL